MNLCREHNYQPVIKTVKIPPFQIFRILSSYNISFGFTLRELVNFECSYDRPLLNEKPFYMWYQLLWHKKKQCNLRIADSSETRSLKCWWVLALVMPQLTHWMSVHLCNFAMLTGLDIKQQLRYVSSPKQNGNSVFY